MTDLYNGDDRGRAEYIYNNVAAALTSAQYGMVEFKGDFVRMTLDRGGVGGIAMYEWVHEIPVDASVSSELIVVDCSTPTVSEEEVAVDIVGEQA